MIASVLLAVLVGSDPVGPPFAWQPGLLPPLRPTAGLAGFEDYATRTGWPRTDSVSAFGAVPWSQGAVALHFDVPRRPRGTVLLVHGYMDHSGLLSSTAKHLLDHGWAVAAPDLPGHGMSSGPRGEITSFSRYGEALGVVLDTLAGRGAPRPWMAIGHSTGGSALLALVSSGDPRIERAVLVAPLVRMNSARWIRAAYPVANAMMEGIDRDDKRRSTHDSAWHERMIADPLELRRIPLGWVRAALAWERQADSIAPGATRWMLVQGDADDVVDAKAGLEVLRRRVPNLRSMWIPGGMHHLLNEGPPWRLRVWMEIGEFLQNGRSPFPSDSMKGTLDPS